MILTLFIITSATFFLMHSIPGDPLAYMAKNLPEQTRENYYAKYGLDKPKTEQYGIFLKNLLTKGELGESLRYPGRSVTRYNHDKFKGVGSSRRTGTSDRVSDWCAARNHCSIEPK